MVSEVSPQAPTGRGPQTHSPHRTREQGGEHAYHDRYSVYNEVVGPAEVMNALLWDVGDKSLHDYFDRITRCN